MSIAGEVRRFGEEIRQRRQALGLTLEELAERTKLSPIYLGEVERGIRNRGPSLEVALKVARGFGVALGGLLGGIKELSAGGIEAGRLYEALPRPLKQPTLQMLRGLVKHSAPRPSG
jgi:transcriptional regulator with XRE-family HTH domain